MTTEPRDPQGKRALFSGAAQDRSDDEAHGSDGKRALFSAAQRPAGTVLVHCSACDARTQLSLAGFVVQHFPAWMWVPWKRYPHLMRCPSCGRLAWHAAS
jgi:hypothetical protein